jgi:hypothetical protein
MWIKVVRFFLNLAKNKSIEETILYHKFLLGNFKFPKPYGASTQKNIN